MNAFRKQPYFFIVALMLAASFLGLLFHHHEPGDQHAHDCPVCRLVQIIGTIFGLLLLVFRIRFSSSTFKSSFQELHSLLEASPFTGRAPPVLS